MRLQNKIGIVTAAGSGMGRAGALRFAQEGAAVAVVDLNDDAADAVVQQITDAGGKAIALVGDLHQRRLRPRHRARRPRGSSAASISSGTMSARRVPPRSKASTGKTSTSR